MIKNILKSNDKFITKQIHYYSNYLFWRKKEEWNFFTFLCKLPLVIRSKIFTHYEIKCPIYNKTNPFLKQFVVLKKKRGIKNLSCLLNWCSWMTEKKIRQFMNWPCKKKFRGFSSSNFIVWYLFLAIIHASCKFL